MKAMMVGDWDPLVTLSSGGPKASESVLGEEVWRDHGHRRMEFCKNAEFWVWVGNVLKELWDYI